MPIFIISVLACMLVAPVPATASEPPAAAGESLQSCIDRALREHRANWVCTGPSAGVPDRSEDDTWCVGNVCHRVKSAYIAASRPDAAYGNQDGVIGTFSVNVNTNLNGRQAKWTINLAWSTGPAIAYVGMNLSCREDKNNLPDSICGSSSFKPAIGPTAVSWTSRTINGERLNNSNPYYAQLSGQFDAGGSRYGMDTLRTLTFNCYGDDNCYFPDRAQEHTA
ncbi:hypothetical protein GCM10009853_072590 [Glycomyces scopariae]